MSISISKIEVTSKAWTEAIFNMQNDPNIIYNVDPWTIENYNNEFLEFGLYGLLFDVPYKTYLYPELNRLYGNDGNTANGWRDANLSLEWYKFILDLELPMVRWITSNDEYYSMPLLKQTGLYWAHYWHSLNMTFSPQFEDWIFTYAVMDDIGNYPPYSEYEGVQFIWGGGIQLERDRLGFGDWGAIAFLNHRNKFKYAEEGRIVHSIIWDSPELFGNKNFFGRINIRTDGSGWFKTELLKVIKNNELPDDPDPDKSINFIKSNSSLIAFNYGASNDDFKFLNFIQSLSLNTKTNRINSKFIGEKKSLTNQFVEPDIDLNITFLGTKDFFNEYLFGFNFGDGSALKKIIESNFFNKDALILFNNLNDSDLINFGSETLKYYVSIGNVYLENYSIVFKLNSLPTVSVDFVCDKFKIGNYKELTFLDSKFIFSSWDASNKIIEENIFSNLKANTERKADRLIYVMNGIFGISNLNQATKIPGIKFSTFLNSEIQEFDININLNRRKMYFFNEKNSPLDRKTILPSAGSIKISGIVRDLTSSDFESFFSSNDKFLINIKMLKNEEVVSEIFCENVVMESYSYSLNINGFLEYSLSCSFQPNEDFLIKVSQYDIQSQNLLASNSDQLISSDGIGQIII